MELRFCLVGRALLRRDQASHGTLLSPSADLNAW